MPKISNMPDMGDTISLYEDDTDEITESTPCPELGKKYGDISVMDIIYGQASGKITQSEVDKISTNLGILGVNEVRRSDIIKCVNEVRQDRGNDLRSLRLS